MPKSRAPYAPEFRQQMIDLVRSGRNPESLSREFEPTAQTIHNWVRQADLDEGRRDDGATSAEREELRRLRRDNKRQRIRVKWIWISLEYLQPTGFRTQHIQFPQMSC